MRFVGRGRTFSAALLAGGLNLPLAAHAHTSVQGMGEFIGGLLHPVVTPSHLLVIIGLGMLAGRTSPPPMKRPMACFIPLTALALALTCTSWVKAVHPVLLHGIGLILGALIASGKSPATAVTCGLFALAALALGFDSGPEVNGVAARVKALLGTGLGLIVLVYDVAIYVSLGAHTNWLKIALRILGAWMVAISVLMLAFALRPPA